MKNYRISKLLKEFRGKDSLREMERLTGIAHTYWATLERGYDLRAKQAINPKYNTLKTLSQLLGKSIDELMEEEQR